MSTATPRRPGSETRAETLRVALDLFTSRGFEGTSIRDIAEATGITKSSIYYHFDGKEAILRALVEDRGAELDELLRWIDAQPKGPDLVRRTALHWVDSTTPERIRGIRFAHANRPMMTKLAAEGGDIHSRFDEVVARVLPAEAGLPERLRFRMALDTVSAALFASQRLDATDQQVLEAARTATLALTAADAGDGPGGRGID
jgi:AcrR family transcriptional regulator